MNNLQCRKAYVRVNLDVDEEGTIIPMLIRWKDGRVFQIEQLKYKCRASSTSSLEAIAKTFRAFYEAAGMTLSKLEVYSDGKPVTVGDMQINCTSLMYGELPVSAVLDGDTNEPTEG